MTGPDAPTLGAYYRSPGVADRIERIRAGARWRMKADLAESLARVDCARRIARAYDSLLHGRRLDKVAVDLRLVAEHLDRVPYQLAHDPQLLEAA